jgi:hypothetical protein
MAKACEDIIMRGRQSTASKVVEFPAPAKVKNPAAVALGKLGAAKGGKARAEKLTESRRKEIAQQAAKARWAKVKGSSEAEGSLGPSLV